MAGNGTQLRWLWPGIVALAVLALVIGIAAYGKNPGLARGWGADLIDYDDDNDGLIDVRSAQQLDAIRHYDGSASRGYEGDYSHADFMAAFPSAQPNMGCDGECIGYELRNDINLDVHPYNAGQGWLPIGTADAGFDGFFDGNGHDIVGLYINRPDRNDVGLFGTTGFAMIQRAGLPGVDVRGGRAAGGLVGRTVSYTTIEAVYVTGAVNGLGFVGGVAGDLELGTISNSYSLVAVTSRGGPAGGLVGYTGDGGHNSYAAGAVSCAAGATCAELGGLTGESRYPMWSSYWDTQTSGQADSGAGIGKTTAELQSPTDATGIYRDWTWYPFHWRFGTSQQYPVLVDGDGRRADSQFALQERRRAAPTPRNLTARATHDAVTLSWQAPVGGAVGSYIVMRRQGGASEARAGSYDAFVTVGSVDGNAISYVDQDGIQPGARYDYRVAVKDGEYIGPAAEVSVTTTAAPLPTSVPAVVDPTPTPVPGGPGAPAGPGGAPGGAPGGTGLPGNTGTPGGNTGAPGGLITP